jgi:NADH:ubiquinone oxidoreductase subunit 4 (subunit M)
MLNLFDLIYIPFILISFLNFFNFRIKNVKIFFFFLSNYIFVNSFILFLLFDCNILQYQFIKTISWSSNLNINYSLGLDGFSIYFFILTTFLIPICILVS